MVKNNKKYIFFTANIHNMGGMQNYVKSKAEFLERNGWQVYVFFAGSKEKGCAFPELDKYVSGGVSFLYLSPEKIYGTPYFWSIINEMLDVIEYGNDSKCEYLIESQADYQAVWGEILAKYIGGKNICFLCNERFRGPDRYYVQYMDFFKWKYYRNELAGIANNSLQMLFQDYLEVESSPRYKLAAATKDNVEYIESEVVDNLPMREWNIAYFGRCEKAYFPFIVKDIKELALKYSAKEIQFIVIGPIQETQMKMLQDLNDIENLLVSCTGSFSVIPKQLFDKLDVVVAGAGCARTATLQGVPTIVADAKTYQATGICGYTTADCIYGAAECSYIELLEDVLIYKTYLHGERPTLQFVEQERAYQNFFDFANKSSLQQEYYSFDTCNEKNLDNHIKGIKYFLNYLNICEKDRYNFIKWLYEQYDKNIGLFGIGKVGSLILKNIPELKFYILFDSMKTLYINNVVERPSKDNIKNISLIIISPISQSNEMKEQLQKEGFAGHIVSFSDIMVNYIKSKLEIF